MIFDKNNRKTILDVCLTKNPIEHYFMLIHQLLHTNTAPHTDKLLNKSTSLHLNPRTSEPINLTIKSNLQQNKKKEKKKKEKYSTY